MSTSAPEALCPAEKVASLAAIATAANGLRYASWGETRLGSADFDRLVNAVPIALSAALENRCYYFVPLVLHEGEQAEVAATYSVDFGDRAVCHRNVTMGSMEGVFISTRLVEDRFGLAFEFFINIAHNFVDAIGVPESFSSLAWSQATAGTRGETSQDAWETRRRATEPVHNDKGEKRPVDEQARKQYEESAFADALAVYLLSLALDFDYHDLREREYPLLAAPALAERLRAVHALFPANPGYEFQILYRRKS